MKTTLAKIQEASKLQSFFVYENGESFPLAEIENPIEEEVTLTDIGYCGRDIDNMETWKVSAAGTFECDSFEVKGVFYNQQDYEKFMQDINK